MESEQDFSDDKCVILCKGCIKLKPEKIANRIEEAETIILEDCSKDFNLRKDLKYVVFCCPALYHLTEHSAFSKIVDLRLIEKCFKKPEEVAIAWIKSSLIFEPPDVKAVETGYEVIYIGNNSDVISELSENTKLCVITSGEVAEGLYPFRTRVIVPEDDNFSISGEVGNFVVNVKGTDLTTNRKGNFSLKGGQIIFPGSEIKKEGIHTFDDEFRCALNAIKNLGSYLRIEPIEIDFDVCCTSKSGFEGCSLCLSCPSGALLRENGKIRIKGSCTGCGYCSAVCPVSAVKYSIMPSDLLMRKIDAVSSEGKTIAFICEDSLKKLYRMSKGMKKKIPEVLPVVVPCINSISELHYLYAALNGMNVLVFPCDSEHKLTNFEITRKILATFGFDCIRIVEFDNIDIKKLRNPGKILKNVEGKNKREKLFRMINLLMKYPVKKSKIETELFGIVEVNEGCTLCMTCTFFCPTGALRKENETLYFNHGLCIACGLCLACPENVITLNKVLDFEKIGEREIYKDEVLKCPSCGRPHITKSMYEKLSKVSKYSILFCSDCRPKVILEAIYEEMMKEEGEERNE